jgi:serine/threonine protein kinase
VASAVHYAHTRPTPIIHCDLKPANILIDAQEQVHILDFGLARKATGKREGNGEIVGTPSYMAPEQASGQVDQIDARTDVYALGAILYEMLAGRPPFVGEPIDVICCVIDRQPDAPSRVLRETANRELPRIPPSLEALCMRCLKKDRDERPATMAEFVSLLAPQ